MDKMEFPATPAEFIKQYCFADTKEVYTNGTELIPVFRMEQLIDHYYLEPEQEFLNKTEAEFTALMTQQKELQKENDFLREQLEQMTDRHARAVGRVNNVHLEKLKVVTQLELLQFMLGNTLERFQQKTED